MKKDVLAWAQGISPDKPISKETLNHQTLVELVSGLDVYTHTAEAFRIAYQALGIDIVNRVPLQNSPPPTADGETQPHPYLPYGFAPLGIYDTAMRHTYAVSKPEDVWDLDMQKLQYEDLITPSPHPIQARDISARETFLGETGLYYPMLYTTLFMWPVEVLGWENFMVSAALEPQRFHDHFLVACAAKSRHLVHEIAVASDSPFVFVHDDLASAAGPMFHPRWYEDHIFSLYPDIFAPAREMGKQIIFVADGNMEAFLPGLVKAGVDGIMFESPTTPLESVIEHFGAHGQYFIGGIDTMVLTFGQPQDIKKMVHQVFTRCRDYPGFAIASGGGLHNNIPIENVEAYFDARVEYGITPADWRGGYKP